MPCVLAGVYHKRISARCAHSMIAVRMCEGRAIRSKAIEVRGQCHVRMSTTQRRTQVINHKV